MKLLFRKILLGCTGGGSGAGRLTLLVLLVLNLLGSGRTAGAGRRGVLCKHGSAGKK